MSQPSPPDWQSFADRLDSLSDELLAASEALTDDMDNQLVQLQAVTLRHYAHHLREYGYQREPSAK